MERLFTAQQVLESWNKSCKAIDDVDQEAKDIVREALELKIAEEQGLLLRLPCGFNDTLYWIVNGNIRECWFKGIRCDKGYKPQIIARCLEWLLSKETPIAKLENIGKTVFLTKEEAEQALAERKNDE